MSQYDDFQKHQANKENQESRKVISIINWVSSLVGTLIVLFVWDLYSTNRAIIQDVSEKLNQLRSSQAEIKVQMKNLERRFDRWEDNNE